MGDGLGQVSLADALELERCVTAGIRDVECVGGEIEQELSGEGVVARVQHCKLRGDVTQDPALGQA
jgi:hypothetical protein